jgi:hypothetical protein
MNAAEFDQITAKLMQTADDISKAKRPAYTIGNVDVLHNFKSVAQRLGISPGQALAVYMTKHYDAIITALTKPELPQAEEITGRFADAINYLKMGYALLAEPEIQFRTKLVKTEAALKDMFVEQYRQQEIVKAKPQYGKELTNWFNPPGPKLATVLQPSLSGGAQAKSLEATPNDRAQIADLGAYMQRAREFGAAQAYPQATPLDSLTAPHAGCQVQDGAALEASAGCLNQWNPAPPSDIAVQRFALPQDTSPL